MPECVLCITCVDDELRYGKLINKDGISVHTYCLYLSSNLVQEGNLKDEFYGFLKTGIVLEKARARKLICYYCKLRGASIGCCATKCSRSFHLPCAINHGTINQFVGKYKSFCSRHLPKIRARPPDNQTCDICFEDLVKLSGFNPATMIYSQCCQKGWFHKYCLQQYANSAGYFFKCPLCNNKTDFLKVRLWGIFVPNCDAAWETETNAFLELSERESHCVAPVCNNATGRNASPFSLIFCTFCGSNPRHVNCVRNNDENICIVCSEMTNTVTEPHKIEREKFKSDGSSDNYDYQLENYTFKEKNHSKIERNLPNIDNSRYKLKNATKCKPLTLSPPREFKSSIFNYGAVCANNNLLSDENHDDAEISCIAIKERKHRSNSTILPNILNDNINSIANNNKNTEKDNFYQRMPTFSYSDSASVVIIGEAVCTNNNLQSDKNHNGGETSCKSTKMLNTLNCNILSIATKRTMTKNLGFFNSNDSCNDSNDLLKNLTYTNKIQFVHSQTELKQSNIDDSKYRIQNVTKPKLFALSHSSISLTPQINEFTTTENDVLKANANCNDSDDQLENWTCKGKIDSKIKQKQHVIESLRYKSMNATKFKPFTLSIPLDALSPAMDDKFKSTANCSFNSNENSNDSDDPLENWAFYKNKIRNVNIKTEHRQPNIGDTRFRKQNVTKSSSLSPINDEVINTAKHNLSSNGSCNDIDDPLENWAYYKNKINSNIEEKQHGIENLKYKSMNATKCKPFTLSPTLESLLPAINDKVKSTPKCSFNESCNDSDDPLENWDFYKNKIRNVNIKTEHRQPNIDYSRCRKKYVKKCKQFTLSP